MMLHDAHHPVSMISVLQVSVQPRLLVEVTPIGHAHCIVHAQTVPRLIVVEVAVLVAQGGYLDSLTAGLTDIT